MLSPNVSTALVPPDMAKHLAVQPVTERLDDVPPAGAVVCIELSHTGSAQAVGSVQAMQATNA